MKELLCLAIGLLLCNELNAKFVSNNPCMALQNGFKMPNSGDCASYFVCEFNQMTKIDCDEGTLFDPDILVCNWAGMVECGETPILRSTMIPEGVTTRPMIRTTTVRTTTVALRTTRAPVTNKPQDVPNESSKWADSQWRPDMQPMNVWPNQNQYWFPNGPMVQEMPGPFYPPMNPGFQQFNPQFPQFYPDRGQNFNPNFNYPSGLNQHNHEHHQNQQHKPHYRPTTAAPTTTATTTTPRPTTPRSTTARTTAKTTSRTTTVATSTTRTPAKAPYITQSPENVIPLEEDLYPKCNDQGLYFLSHPKNCESYFICANGMLVLHSCAAGIHWNEKASQCDFPHRANCFAANDAPTSGAHLLKPASPDLPDCKGAGMFFPCTWDCAKYYICIAEAPVIMTCPNNYLWNAEISQCDNPKSVSCSQSQED